VTKLLPATRKDYNLVEFIFSNHQEIGGAIAWPNAPSLQSMSYPGPRPSRLLAVVLICEFQISLLTEKPVLVFRPTSSIYPFLPGSVGSDPEADKGVATLDLVSSSVMAAFGELPRYISSTQHCVLIWSEFHHTFILA
jgi:hypothetical protein